MAHGVNKELKRKRFNSVFSVVATAGAGGFTTSVPTPAAEVPKQVVLGFADIAVCVYIWKEYFGEEITEASMKEALQQAGLVTTIACAGGYLTFKAATGLLHEVLNLIALPGKIASGLIAFSGTAALGFTWMAVCDSHYRKRLDSGLEMSATRA